MTFKDFNFSLDSKTREKRDQLVKELGKHPKVIEFMALYDCPFSVIETNALKFKRWIEDMERVATYTESALRNNPSLGSYVNLVYDKKNKALRDEFTYVSLSQKVKEEMMYRDNYAVFQLHNSLMNAEFSNIQIDKETPSYLKAMQEAIAFTKENTLGLYFYGDLGVGKSFLSACITNKLAKEGKSVAFVSPADLLNHLKGNFGNFTQDPTLDRLKRVDVLVLDDLGAEPITPWARDEVLLPLLNARMENYRKTLFTSNYPPEMLEEVYALDSKGTKDVIRSKRFVDRVLAIAKPVEIAGINRRRR